MDYHKLWEKLYSRNNDETEIELHSAGAAVRHRNPFENLEVPRNDAPLTKEFIDTWVIPCNNLACTLTRLMLSVHLNILMQQPRINFYLNGKNLLQINRIGI